MCDSVAKVIYYSFLEYEISKVLYVNTSEQWLKCLATLMSFNLPDYLQIMRDTLSLTNKESFINTIPKSLP